MKSIKLLLSSVLIFIAIGANAQDDFYNNKSKKKKEITEVVKDSVVSINDYSTEQDFNEKNKIETSYEVYDPEVEEIYEDENKTRKRRRNTFAAEVAAEVFVEVLINTVFIIATFWN
ncbi:MAG: hypothetical protein P1U41_04790 [Vicingaceae bacterium]|nr:hypothetical protein [Vicingaceae bacterium]